MQGPEGRRRIDKSGPHPHSVAPFVIEFQEQSNVANIASAKKRARQSEVNRQRNASARSMLRTYVRKVVLAIEKGDKEAARSAYATAVPVIDRMVNKGIIHRNKAARHKSRLSARILALS